MEDRILRRVLQKLESHDQPRTSQGQPKTSNDPGELLQMYYEAQKSKKNKSSTAFPAAKRKKTSDAESVQDEVLVDVCYMERSRRGWVARGDKRKLLVDNDETFSTLVAKCKTVLGFTAMPHALLIAGGAIIGQDSFRNLGHYMAVTHLKPDKVLFGIAAGKEEEDVSAFASDLSPLASDSGLPMSSSTIRTRGKAMPVSGTSKFTKSLKGSATTPLIIDDDNPVNTFAAKLCSLGVHVYTDKDILQLTAHLDKMEFVREGGFGEIYVGTFACQKVALKKVKEDKETFKVSMEQLANEATLLTRYRQRHLVPIVGVCPGPEIPAILYEYMEEGSLYDHVHTLYDIIDLEENVRILWESAQGLTYLHEEIGSRQSVTHCDVKSSNILLDEHKVAKVGDFGLAKAMPQVMGGRSYITCAAHGGSLGYQAPEILEGEISPKFDVYSLGVVILEVFSGLKAYSRNRVDRKLVDHAQNALETVAAFKQLQAIFYVACEPFKYDYLRLLIVKMLKPRSSRLTMSEVEAQLKSLYQATLRA